jgi:alpha-glucosidase
MARLSMMILLSLRGNPIIYQGEELALPQGEVAFEDLQDPEAIANWPHTLGRDGSRTPFPWAKNAPHAGFSNANQTWLKVDPEHATRAVDGQSDDETSALNHTRDLLALRRSLRPLVTGSSELLGTPPAMIAFIRRTGEEAVLCAYNLGPAPCEWTPPAEFTQGALVATQAIGETGASISGVLAPHSGYWAVKKGA